MGNDTEQAASPQVSDDLGGQGSFAGMMPVRRDDFDCHEIDGEAILYDDAHDTTFHLNRAGYLIWRSCDGRTSPDGIAQRLTRFFDVSEAVARTDVGRFLDRMYDSSLLAAR